MLGWACAGVEDLWNYWWHSLEGSWSSGNGKIQLQLTLIPSDCHRTRGRRCTFLLCWSVHLLVEDCASCVGRGSS